MSTTIDTDDVEAQDDDQPDDDGHPIFDRELDNNAEFAGIIDTGVLDMRLRHIMKTVDEFRLRVTEDGLGIRAVDSGNVSMIQLVIAPEHFDMYRVEQEGQVGVSVDRLREYLKSMDTDQATMKIDPETRELRVSDMDSRVHAGGGLIDPDAIRMEPDLPDLQLPSIVTVKDISIVRSFLKKLSKGEHVRLQASENGLSFLTERDTDDIALTLWSDEALGPDEGDVTVEDTSYNGHPVSSVPSTVEELHDGAPIDGDSLFSAEYFRGFFDKLLKRHTSGVSYQFRLGDEFPVIIDRETEFDGDECRLMLAPRIGAD